jgi:integrase/recombinase XerD
MHIVPGFSRASSSASRLAKRFAKRFVNATGSEFPLEGKTLERAVGKVVRTVPGPDEIAQEILETALEEAMRRGLAAIDLAALARALEHRRDAWEVIVRRGLEIDRKLAHVWFRGVSSRPAPQIVNTVVLARLKVELKSQNRRPRTIQAYLTGAEQFANLLYEGKRSFLDASADDVRAFKVRLIARKLAPASINLRLSGTKSLYRLLAREKLAEHEILEGFQSMPVEKRIRTLLDAGEVERVLAAIDEASPLGLRDGAFLRVLFATAARVGELVHLKLADLDLERGQAVFATRKNREDHLALVPPPVVEALVRYFERGRPKLLEKARSSAAARHELVFLSRRGGVFHRGNANDRVKKYARAAGIRKNVTTHVFRRSVSTVLAEAGMAPELIRIFLGHRKLSTTLSSYVAYSKETLRANLQKYHPWFAGDAVAAAEGGSEKPS